MSDKPNRRGRGEGALFYSAERDRWIGRVVVDGTRRSVSARSKSDARKQLDALRRTVDDGKPVTPGAMTVEDLLTTWARKALPNRNLSPSRLAGHRWAIDILIEDIGRLKLRSLTADQVEAAFVRRAEVSVPAVSRAGRGGRRRGSLSRSSLVKVRSTLNQALSWAQRRDLVTRNVASLIELPAAATPAKTGKSLTLKQANRLLAAAAGTELEAMWMTMLYLDE